MDNAVELGLEKINEEGGLAGVDRGDDSSDDNIGNTIVRELARVFLEGKDVIKIVAYIQIVCGGLLALGCAAFFLYAIGDDYFSGLYIGGSFIVLVAIVSYIVAAFKLLRLFYYIDIANEKGSELAFTQGLHALGTFFKIAGIIYLACICIYLVIMGFTGYSLLSFVF